MHLCNYSINKYHSDYVKSSDPDLDDQVRHISFVHWSVSDNDAMGAKARAIGFLCQVSGQGQQ
jgi:hypothetical protein